MKLFLSLLFSIFISITAFSQNGVYLYGFMENAPEEPVMVDVTFTMESGYVSTTLFTEPDGNIDVVWVDFPQTTDFFLMEAGFIDCNGNYNLQAWQSTEFPNLIDIPLFLNYCLDSLLYGCTDPEALNYNPQAIYNDGSCVYEDECTDVEIIIESMNPIETYWTLYSNTGINLSGFLEPGMPITECLEDGCYTLYLEQNWGDSLNYGYVQITANGEFILNQDIGYNQPISFEIGSGCNSIIYGCTDPEALNYNPQATQDDGSCQYETNCDLNEIHIEINTQSWGQEISWNLLDSDSNLVASGANYNSNSDYLSNWCLEDGCYTFIMLDSFGDGWNGGSFEITSDEDLLASGTLITGNYGIVNFGINQEGCSDIAPVYGCTDPQATNYNPWATIDDGSCQYITTIENDLCSNAFEIYQGSTILINNVGATQNENIWGECWGFGQGEGEQSSVWYTFTTPDYPASIHLEALYDGTNTFTDTQFGLFEECGGPMIYCDGNAGEGLMSALDFECGELEENTAYILMVDGWNGDNGTCFLQYLADSACTTDVWGCTDPQAINYNPEATIDDGSCDYETECSDVEILVYPNNDFLESFWVLTSTNGYYESGYVQSAIPIVDCLEDGCYTFYLEQSWTDTLLNSTYVEITANGVFIIGQDVWMNQPLSFEIGAGCNPPIYGCTDPNAINYNPEATQDDGSCEYDTNCELNSIQVVINTGTWANEVSWNLLNADSMSVANGSGYSNNLEYVSQWCLADGCYTLEMFDTFGDGWNGGSFQVIMNGEYIASGALYTGSYGNVNFGINQEGCADPLPIYGCTDPQAINYNPEASIDDGSCVYDGACTPIYINLVGYENINGYWTLTSTNGFDNSGYYMGAGTSISDCLTDGCYTFSIVESLIDSLTPISYNVFTGENVLVASGIMSEGDSFTFGVGTGCDSTLVYGCTDPEAINYNPNANVDDGSCEYEIDCDLNLIEVVIYTQQWGYEIAWNIVNSDSVAVAGGENYNNYSEYTSSWCLADGCYTFEMYDSFGDGWNGGEFDVWLNGELVAFGTLDNGNYGAITFGVNQEGCEITQPIYGCTDSTAINYNPEATVDDGSCVYDSGCTPVLITIEYYSASNTEWQLTSTSGYTAGGAIFGQVLTIDECLEDGCYTLEILGAWGDTLDLGYYTVYSNNQFIANGELGFMQNGYFEIGVGCDSTSVIYGCTDPSAYNYNPTATEDDGSCIYQFDCSIDFFVIPDSTGEDVIWIVPTANILAAVEVLWDFGDGTTSTDLFPTHTYVGDGPFTLCLTATFESPDGSSCSITFCAVLTGEMVGGPGFTSSDGGFTINVINDQSTVGIEEPESISQLALWPNPTNGQLNLRFNSSTSDMSTIDIMDITGKLIFQKQLGGAKGEVSNTIDVSKLPSGVYLLKLSNTDAFETKRFVIAQ